jgi:hypothetical protein
MMFMEVAAQWVRTSWTKRSRGGVEARRRSAVPVVFPLPETALPMTHEVTLDERSLFVPREVLHRAEPVAEEVELTEDGGMLRVYLTAYPFGTPCRWRRPPAVRLEVGQWLRWQINYRIPGPCCGEGSYRQDTLNLAYGKVCTNIFQGTPSHRRDERAHLR